MRNQEEKIELQKKIHRRICVIDIRAWLHAFLPMSLFDYFLRFYVEKNIFTPENYDGDGVGEGGVLEHPATQISAALYMVF